MVHIPFNTTLTLSQIMREFPPPPIQNLQWTALYGTVCLCTVLLEPAWSCMCNIVFVVLYYNCVWFFIAKLSPGPNTR